MRSRRLVLPAALVLSGAAALAVEVLWQRMLVRLLGGSTAAVTAVLVAYMGGLALGAGLAGRAGERLSPDRALKAYVRLEIAVWLCASAATLLLAVLPVGIGGTLASLPDGPRFAARLGASALVLILPTTAMGATLPLAVRAWTASGGAAGLLRGTGLLYAANTAGAVLGALAAPILLMPAFGVRGGALAAAGGSLLAALLVRFGATAARVADAAPAADANAAPAADAAPGPPAPFPLVAAAALASGAAALGCEVVWSRLLGTLAGSNVYAFAIVLALVLVGLALGSAAAGALSRRLEPASACGLLAVVGPVLAVTLLPLLDRIPGRFQALAGTGGLSLATALGVVFGIGALAILPPMLAAGAVVPLAVAAAAGPGHRVAGAVGRVYVANTLGALAGALVTGLILVPRVGATRAPAFLAGAAVLAGTTLMVASVRRARLRVLMGLLGAAAGTALLVAPRPSPYAGGAAIHAPRQRLAVGRVLYYGEGPEASVLVEAVGSRRTFYVSGRPEASDERLDVRNQYLLGYLPALLAGGAPRSLVIGLGSGMTAGTLTAYGDVTVAELNRAVLPAARLFGDLNHDAVDHARVRIEDGRVVLAEDGRWDLITTDPIHPYVAGSAALYTTEHFRLCRRRLAPGGAVSLWVPLHQMGEAELRAIVGSFVDVFPDAELWLSQYNAVLVGGGRPRDAAAVRDLLRAGWNGLAAADLRFALLASPDELAVSRVAGPEELRRFTAGARRNLDDDPWIELSLPRWVYRATVARNIEMLLALRPPGDDPLWPSFAAVQQSYAFEERGRLDLALAALSSTPPLLLEHRARLREVSSRLAGDLLSAGRGPEAFALARAEAVHPDATLDSLRAAGEVLGDDPAAKQELEALAERLTREWPDFAEGHLRLGELRVTQRRWADAIPPLERALALDRWQGWAWLTWRLLGQTRLMLGDLDRGHADLRRSLELRPDQAEVEALLAASPDAIEAMRRELGP